MWPLTCPVCDAGLERRNGVLVCDSGHSHDIARERYVNLLVSQHAERGIEGDSREMLLARRRFLEGGHYAALCEQLAARVRTAVQDVPGSRCVVEAGCGVGYYIGSIADDVQDERTRFVGLDISKAAVRIAAKRYRAVTFAVANTRRRLYLETGSVNVLLDVFAPRNVAEFARVVAPGGTLLVVIPGPDHLAGLREQVRMIGVQESKPERVVEQLGGAFVLADRAALDYTVHLRGSAVQDLIGMSPSSRHSPHAAPDAADVQLSFVLMQFERFNGQA